MPRTQGAKNKPKPAEYHLEKLKELGLDIAEITGKPKAKKEKKTPELPAGAQVIDEATGGHIRKKFELESPNAEKNEPDLSGQLLRCGNPACGKILQEQYSKCPFCGCKLEWL